MSTSTLELTSTALRPLAGRVAVVTGGGRGIGAAIAKALGAAGADVVVNYATSAAAAGEVAKAIVESGSRAIAVAADVTGEAAVRRLIDESVKAFGKVDILVNNAGIAPMQPLEALESQTIDQLFALNVRATLIASREAVKHMGPGGRIINLSSVVATGAANMAAYAATKAAVNAITRSLAVELGPKGITVNAVAPGATETDMFEPLRGMTDYILSRTPLGRLGQTKDVANAVLFLALPSSEFVTGQTLGVDGGISF